MKSFLKVAARAALILGLALPASAAPTLFIAEWSGAGFGNGASATGMVTLDPDLNPGSASNTPFDAFFSAISITISGASVGDGVFTTPDFSVYYWDGTGVDFNTELVGQAGFLEFNFFTSNPSAPRGSETFEITTGGGSGDRLLLTSLRLAPVATPELNPASAATPVVLCLGLFALYSGRRRAAVRS
ncbi:MAG: hypothetical protein J0I12_28355 [Candidatus Eremiobacteraeota bacterium]|nr:hypothetical protein [Candidatus Eremiobacteraeota bacterium]